MRFLLAGLAMMVPVAAGAQVAVTTYHNDTYRTGWNAGETVLNNVTAGSVQLLHQVALDAQTDTQPLVVPGVDLGAAGKHDVVYVATAANTLYAIDAQSGAILLRRNFGAPVPQSSLPGACGNNDQTVGITGTPVIDAASGTLYLVAYLAGTEVPTYEVHAVNIATLADRVAPQTISAVGKLSNRLTYNFQPAVTRQRAALLEANGNIYAAFTSFCDLLPRSSRGWVLGWNAATLAPMQGVGLQNRRWDSPLSQFLTTIWMSGYGIAADRLGALYFATSNSDKSGKSWAAKFNLPNSVIKLSRNLQQVQSYFTPTGAAFGQAHDDEIDADIGSGGVMLVPEAGAQGLHLAVAAGKTSPVILLDRDNMGGRGLNFLVSVPSAGCWCGPSYFTGNDGIGRVVLSTGKLVTMYQVQTTPTVGLVHPVKSTFLNTGQDPGFFTSVSSNGTKAGSAVVWAVTRPINTDPGTVSLIAVDGGNGAILRNVAAGVWPNAGGNANIVPTVANGHVYVASYKNLSIFGLPGSGAVAQSFRAPPVVPAAHTAPHQASGTITALSGDRMTLRLRDGRVQVVDLAPAREAGLLATPTLGGAATARGDYRGRVLVATTAQHAKPAAGNWPADW